MMGKKLCDAAVAIVTKIYLATECFTVMSKM
jgi:hypothetical protein